MTPASIGIAIVMISAAAAVRAEDDSAGDFKFKSYLEAAYNHLSASDRFTSGVQDRVFDTHQGVDLQRLGMEAQFLPKAGVGGRIDLNLGNDSIGMAPSESYPGTAKIDLTQMYGQIASGNVTVMAGKLITLLGVEYLESPLDVNFSHSILFGYATPFTHIGVRAAYAASDALTLYLGINNGWDHLPGKNSLRTLELALVATPTTAFNVYATSYIGREHTGQIADTGPEGRRIVVDTVGIWRPIDALTLTLNANWAQQQNAGLAGFRASTATWSGKVLYATYRFNDRWSLSLRGERFADRNGYRTGVAQNWSEVTGTVGCSVSKRLELRAELRKDTSDEASFRSRNDAGALHGQRSMALQVLWTL